MCVPDRDLRPTAECCSLSRSLTRSHSYAELLNQEKELDDKLKAA